MKRFILIDIFVSFNTIASFTENVLKFFVFFLLWKNFELIFFKYLAQMIIRKKHSKKLFMIKKKFKKV